VKGCFGGEARSLAKIVRPVWASKAVRDYRRSAASFASATERNCIQSIRSVSGLNRARALTLQSGLARWRLPRALASGAVPSNRLRWLRSTRSIRSILSTFRPRSGVRPRIRFVGKAPRQRVSAPCPMRPAAQVLDQGRRVSARAQGRNRVPITGGDRFDGSKRNDCNRVSPLRARRRGERLPCRRAARRGLATRYRQGIPRGFLGNG
jgi:hypothetical protein